MVSSGSPARRRSAAIDTLNVLLCRIPSGHAEERAFRGHPLAPPIPIQMSAAVAATMAITANTIAASPMSRERSSLRDAMPSGSAITAAR